MQTNPKNLGLILLAVGFLVLLLGATFGSILALVWRFWPLAIVYYGYRRSQSELGSREGRTLMIIGAALTLVTLGVFNSGFGGVGGIWPLLLILGGGYLLLRQTDGSIRMPDLGNLRDTFVGNRTVPAGGGTATQVRTTVDARLNLFTLFGTQERTVAPGPSLGGQATAVFSTVRLDLSQTLMPTGSDLTLTSLFSSIDVTMPKGVNVQLEPVILFGSVDEPTPISTLGAPTVVVRAVSLFGSINIRQ